MELLEGGPDWSKIFGRKGDRALAAKYWSQVASQLRVTPAIAHLVERLVVAYVAYDTAAKQVAKSGAVIAARKTGVPTYSPWWAAMRQAAADARTLERELCLTPKTSTTKAAVPTRAPSAADRYLKAV